MLIDQDSPANAWIKVENRPVESEADSRPSDASFRKDDEDFFIRSLGKYQTLLNSSQGEWC
jgi:hypothetical protein